MLLKELSDFRFPAFQRPAQGRGVELFVTQMDVCPVSDKKLDHILVPVDRRPMQPRRAEKPATVDVRAFLKQKIGDVNVPIPRGDGEGFRNQLGVGFRRSCLAPSPPGKLARTRLPGVGFELSRQHKE